MRQNERGPEDEKVIWKSYLPTAPRSPSFSSWSSPFVWVTFGIGCLASSGLILRYGVNVFFLDEWDLASLLFQGIMQGDSLWSAVWEQANEHRPVLSRLAFYLLSLLPSLDLRFLMIFNQLLLWLTVFPLFASIQGRSSHTFLICFLVLVSFLSPTHHSNQFWSMQLMWYAIWFGGIYSCYFLSKPKLTKTDFAAGLSAAFFAYFGGLAGAVCLLNGLVMLALRCVSEKKYVPQLLLWLLFTLGALLYYFSDFQSSGRSLFYFAFHPLETLIFACVMLANLVGTDYAPVSAAVGGLGLVYFAFLFWQKRFDRNLFIFGIIQNALAASLVISIGRAEFQLEQAFAHYGMVTMPFWIGLILLANPPRRFHRFFLLFIGMMLLITFNKKWQGLERSYANRERGVQCYHAVIAHPESINPDILPFRDCKFLGPAEFRQDTIQKILKLKDLGIRFPQNTQ
ncbi:MAG: hypothetical protein HQM13_18985 [SAR324 cluster bacterium]|nr:hypothetical protein [SAR324 cluster bacterium]